jgi:hypothetical protein
MDDTSQEVNARFREMLMKKSGQERLQMGFSMYDLARDQVIASLQAKGSEDGRKMREEIFLRFYRQDFPQHVREKIVTYLKEYER